MVTSLWLLVNIQSKAKKKGPSAILTKRKYSKNEPWKQFFGNGS